MKFIKFILCLLLKYLIKYENTINVAIHGINWGLGELIKNIVTGVKRIIIIKIKFLLFFLSLKIGINENKDEN